MWKSHYLTFPLSPCSAAAEVAWLVFCCCLFSNGHKLLLAIKKWAPVHPETQGTPHSINLYLELCNTEIELPTVQAPWTHMSIGNSARVSTRTIKSMIPPSFTKLNPGASTVEFTENRRGTMQDTVILQSFAFLERNSPFFKCHAMTNTHVGWYLTYKGGSPTPEHSFSTEHLII